MRIALAFASITLALAACGDNIKPNDGNPDAADIDAPTLDAPTDVGIDANCPSRPMGMVGGPCTTDAQCDNGVAGDGLCLNNITGGIVGWPAEGYCITKYDGCTMDSECGAGNVCVTISDPAGAFRACMPACGTGACVCGNGQACSDNFAGSTMNKDACLPGNPSAIDGDPCTGFGECDLDSICRNDSFEHPGGQCMQIGCTIGTDSTCTSGGDGHCIDPQFVTPGTGCVDVCATDANCRVADGYKCFDGGGAIGKYCRHPETGDACATDADCGNPTIWDCKTGVTFPGGYCTIQAACAAPAGAGCSSGSSVCYDSLLPDPIATDNYCVDRCPATGVGTQSTCRAGYTCRDVDPAGPAGPPPMDQRIVGGCVNP